MGDVFKLTVDNEYYWFRGIAAGETIEFPKMDTRGAPCQAMCDTGHFGRALQQAIAAELTHSKHPAP
jgi:hypothetical protein